MVLDYIKELDIPLLRSDEIDYFAGSISEPMFAGRRASKIHRLDNKALVITWTIATDVVEHDTCLFEDSRIVGVHVHGRSKRGYDEGTYMLNARNALVLWAMEARRRKVPGIEVLWKCLGDAHVTKARHLIAQYARGGALTEPIADIVAQSYVPELTFVF